MSVMGIAHVDSPSSSVSEGGGGARTSVEDIPLHPFFLPKGLPLHTKVELSGV